MIEGVSVTPLRQISDERGKVMHLIKRSWPVFQDFGEVYFSCIYPKAVKAWHWHERMVLNLAVPVGEVRLVLFDERPQSATRGRCQEILLGPEQYQLVTVPPQVWSGFQALSAETALLANCASLEYDPAEIRRRDPHDPSIPYRWSAGPA